MKGKNSIRISLSNQDVRFGGYYIPFRLIRPVALDMFPDECMAFELKSLRKFNRTTGEIERKFAWDSILIGLKEDKKLARVLRRVLVNEASKNKL